MTNSDSEKYEELLHLKHEIDSQLEDIKSRVDDETYKKLENKKIKIEEKYRDADVNKKIKKANKSNDFLSTYQRFLNAFEFDVDIDPGRLLGLTDGIFGMVMTLLIFGMALPSVNILTEGDFVSFIESIIPNIGITVVSFILIASFWIYHHEFIKVRTLNLPYLWLNVLFLICISFIPFTTSLIGSYSRFFISEEIFGLNIFLTLLFFILMYWYANHRGFVEKKVSNEKKKYTYNTFFIIMGLTMIVNLLDYNVSCNFIYLFFLVPVISTIRDIRFRMKT